MESLLTQLPVTWLGIAIVQHMPEIFTAMFAQRLNGLCQIEAREAQNGDRVFPGRALIAPGSKHMMLKRSGAQYIVEIVSRPSGQSASPIGRRAFPLHGQVRGQERPRHHHDRNGG